ncbi:hypothetical protein B0H19DRAFT_1263358 [Mycena capillaripes]|nr:hypothetical protein B0H19DRAFT_1263358 [Mycena capillaripes]
MLHYAPPNASLLSLPQFYWHGYVAGTPSGCSRGDSKQAASSLPGDVLIVVWKHLLCSVQRENVLKGSTATPISIPRSVFKTHDGQRPHLQLREVVLRLENTVGLDPVYMGTDAYEAAYVRIKEVEDSNAVAYRRHQSETAGDDGVSVRPTHRRVRPPAILPSRSTGKASVNSPAMAWKTARAVPWNPFINTTAVSRSNARNGPHQTPSTDDMSTGGQKVIVWRPRQRSDARIQHLLLAAALSALTSLRAVIWKVHASDPEWTRDVISRSFDILHVLGNVQQEVGGGLDIPLGTLSGLMRLKVTSTYSPQTPLVLKIAQIIVQNQATLTILHIVGSDAWSQIWTLLASMRGPNPIQLRDLTNNNVTPALLNYLGS